MVLLSTAGIASSAAARDVTPAVPVENLPLNQYSIPDALDDVSELNTFWRDESIVQDTKFVFGIPAYKDRDLVRTARRTEQFYRQMLYQMPGQQILRTRDLASPFCDSLLDTPSPCAVSVQPQRPMQPALRPVAPPAPPVRGLY